MMNKIEGYDYRSKDYISIEYMNEKITAITIQNEIPYEKRCPQILTPGFFDLQINGYGGVDFNNVDITSADIFKITHLLNSKGTLNFVPTIITNTPESISKLIFKIRTAVDTYPECRQSIAGIQLEGPFISREDGPRGAHPLEYVRKPDIALVKKWLVESGGLLKIITLSPEYSEANKVIEFCSQNGIIASIGHTAATKTQIRAAINYGATLSTHLGNGSHTVLPRHDNYIWEQLASEELNCTLIGDGIHLPKSILKCMLQIKKEKAMLISDSSEIAGLPPGYYETHVGGKVLLTKENRLCLVDNTDLLAGSAACLLDEIDFLSKNDILSLYESIVMCSTRPAHFLNRNIELKVGNTANLLAINKLDTGISIQTIIKNGRIIQNN